MIFIDSDAFIGASVSTDPHNLSCERLFSVVEERDEDTFTSWEVVDEVITKLSYHVGRKTALVFWKNLKNSNTRIVFVNGEMSKSVIEQFKKQTSKNVSLTDCANMIIAKELEIDIFFSFDRHYKQNGFKLLGETI